MIGLIIGVWASILAVFYLLLFLLYRDDTIRCGRDSREWEKRNR